MTCSCCNNVNDAPTGTATALLPAGTEDTPYLVSAAVLLQGFSDVDVGDVLAVANLTADRGAVTDNGDGTYTIAPEANHFGPMTLSYAVIDDNGGSVAATQSFVLAPVNDAPVAAALAVSTNEDTVLSGTLPAAGDVDGDTVTYAMAGGAAFGTVSVGADGSFIYTPAANFHGDDGFSYVVSDGNGGSSTYTVSVNVAPVNDTPVAVADNAVTSRNTAVAIDVLANDSDVDAGDTLTVTAFTQPANGNVRLDAATGQLVYTPRNNWLGTTAFTYTVSDAAGATATGTVTVVVGNTVVGTEGNDTLNGTNGADVIDGRGGNDVINAGGGSDIVFGRDGDDTITGGAGADELWGAAGNDRFLVSGTDLTGDTIDGGDGQDTLVFTGSVTPGGGFAVQNVETLDMGGFALSVKTTARVDLSGMDVVNVGAITGDNAANAIVGTRGSDVINGQGGNDNLSGGLGNDVVYGGAGADMIRGGTGNDTLFGGSNAKADKARDTFVFDTPLDGSTNVDTITGFEANGTDQIALDPAVFAALLGGTTNGLDANELRANSGGNAQDADDFILYDTATGNLFYDADGNGAGGKVLFATLTQPIGTLDHTDFTTVVPLAP